MLKKISICSLVIFISSVLFLVTMVVPSSWSWPRFFHDNRHTGYTTSLASDTTAILWKHQTEDVVISPLTVADGRVFGGDEDGYVYCLEESSGNEIWKTKINSWVWSASVVSESRVFVSAGLYVYCLDEADGDVLWKYETRGSPQTPAVADGRVFVGSLSGSGTDSFYCLDKSNGNVLWKYQPDAVCSSPAVDGGKVFFGSFDGYIYCLDEFNGDLFWKYQTGSAVQSSPSVSEDKVFITSNNRYLYSLDKTDGSLLWKSQIDGVLFKIAPTIANSKIFIASEGYVYCLREDDGYFIWKRTLGFSQDAAIAVADGRLFIGSYGILEQEMHKWPGVFWILNEVTGELVWHYNTSLVIHGAPAIADGKMFFGADNFVYCFGPSNPNIWLTRIGISLVLVIMTISAVFVILSPYRLKNPNKKHTTNTLGILFRGLDILDKPKIRPVVFGLAVGSLVLFFSIFPFFLNVEVVAYEPPMDHFLSTGLSFSSWSISINGYVFGIQFITPLIFSIISFVVGVCCLQSAKHVVIYCLVVALLGEGLSSLAWWFRTVSTTYGGLVLPSEDLFLAWINIVSLGVLLWFGLTFTFTLVGLKTKKLKSPEAERAVSERREGVEKMVLDYIINHNRKIRISKCAKELGITETEVEEAIIQLQKKGLLRSK